MRLAAVLPAFLGLLLPVRAFLPANVYDASSIIDAVLRDTAADHPPYDKDQIPTLTGQGPLHVNTTFYLTEIIDFDSISEYLQTMVWVSMDWVDDRLKWNPEEHGGVTRIRIQPDRMWIPDLTLYNSANGGFQFSAYMFNQVHVQVDSDGHCSWTPLVSYTTTCPLHMRYFPFDIQMCQIMLGPWVHTTEMVIFKLVGAKADTSRFQQKNVWFLRDTLNLYREYFFPGFGVFQEMHFYLIMARNYTQYMVNVVMTVGVLVLVTFFRAGRGSLHHSLIRF